MRKSIRFNDCDEQIGSQHALAERGYDPNYGARPLKRLIEREIVNVLAKKLLAGAFHDRDTIAVDLGPDGEFTFTRQPPPTETDSTSAAYSGIRKG